MNAKEKAIELIEKFTLYLGTDIKGNECFVNELEAKQCALITVTEIINSNPHSNPFNTDVHSTMKYWIDVKTELSIL